MNPNLPVTAEEIAADVRRCADAGAVVFHVHARDKDQKPTFDIDVFKESARRIKKIAPEVIIQLSTGARAGKDREARANPVRLLPEMASFTTGSNNLPGIVYENSPEFIEFLAGVFKETGVTLSWERRVQWRELSKTLCFYRKVSLPAPPGR
jgi:3-keto-5-aminohexanoate cleavage enzyme